MKLGTERCDFCDKEIFWYLYEDHMNQHYDEGDFADRETENRVAQKGAEK